MNNLFDDTEKLVKFNRSVSQQLEIKHVLNPYTQSFIDVEQANALGILFNGYYRNRYGGLIPLHIAASKGLIEFRINNQIDNEEMEIEYRSKYSPYATTLLIRQVYDYINQTMISYQQAIDKGYLDLELFIYTCSTISMSIHEAFYHGLILGELRTNLRQDEKFFKPQIVNKKENQDFEYDIIFSTLTNLVNSLCEFTNTIKINEDCQLTSDGYIQNRKTEKCYLLTKAIELGLVSFEDNSKFSQLDKAENHSTIVDDTQMDISHHDEEDFIPEQNLPLFSDTFIFDLLKSTGNSKEDIQMNKTNINKLLSVMNTC